ncbi:hypothetical protein ACIHAX_20785 [Nocardia sp. NPDC051929]|uniref:hypothetical protein n=1 Tax=unclassified Nocardia TaxID=2637762 RepID=UPI00342790C4
MSTNPFWRSLSIVAVSALLAAPAYSRADPVGDSHPNDLDRFYHQPLEWKPCGVENLDKAGGECANVAVPLDYGRPGGRTITLAISRVKASDPARRRGVHPQRQPPGAHRSGGLSR